MYCIKGGLTLAVRADPFVCANASLAYKIGVLLVVNQSFVIQHEGDWNLACRILQDL